MDDYTYLDIYAKTYLNEIKAKIKHNNILLSGTKEKETDEYMIEVIKSLCIKPRHNLDDKEKFILKILPTNTPEDAERIFTTLMLYYTAIYNENMELLNRLLEEGFDFGIHRHNQHLVVLDKKISSKFNIDVYIDLIKTQTSMIESFILSIKDPNPIYKSTISNNYPEELSTEEVIEKFVHILNQNSNVAKPKNSIYTFINVLTKKTINYFDEYIILNATEEQKENIIRQINFTNLTKQSVIRLNCLMIDRNFSTNIYKYWNEVLEELSDYELIKINELDKDIFKDSYFEICHENENKSINPELYPKLYIKKIREKLNQKLKTNNKQELIKQLSKKKLLQRLKK